MTGIGIKTVSTQIRKNMETRPDLKNVTRTELVSWLQNAAIAPYRADQIFKWVYVHQADDFTVMTNISKEIRHLLSQTFSLERLKIIDRKEGADGTRKYLLQLSDGECIESVLIPEEGHDTLCISTQVGCAQGCRFCLTARRGFTRNLTCGEILSQIRDVRQDIPHPDRLRNIVLMGMGEPLANYTNVLKALEIITDGDCGLKFSTRKVTLSTVGLIPGLKRLGRETSVNLAVSLNATTNDVRSRLMPANNKYPLEKLLAVCAAYPLSPRRKITFEYVLIKGVNDSEADAGRLTQLLNCRRAKINLIPFNEHEKSDFQRPSDRTVETFRNILHHNKFTVITRLSKGADIYAACGQLTGEKRPVHNNKRTNHG